MNVKVWYLFLTCLLVIEILYSCFAGQARDVLALGIMTVGALINVVILVIVFNKLRNL